VKSTDTIEGTLTSDAILEDEWDSFDDNAIKSIIAICTVILLVLGSGIIYIAWNNWWNDELIGPGTFLTSRQQNYENLVGFSNIEWNGYGVTACIVDSGIDLTHPDLHHLNLKGWKDFINSRSDVYDDHGHGTMMAGIMVAKGGLNGLASGVELLVAKALSKDGSGSNEAVSNAIDWCRTNNADVISLSLGGAPGIAPSFLGGDSVATATLDAISEGIYVVAAAGNDGEDDGDDDVDSPCSEEDVICVGGVGIEGDIWSGSSKGSNNFQLIPPKLSRQDPDKKPELVAPAESVPVLLSTNTGANEPSTATYGTASGTSAATVYVSSAIILMLQANPNLSRDGSSGGDSDAVENVKQWIKESCKPKNNSEEHDDYYGYGLLQVHSLINRTTSA
jgi:serine protease AprX